ncbi:MAG TPA: MFS transporter, partial [Polyangiaceae bacterium]
AEPTAIEPVEPLFTRSFVLMLCNQFCFGLAYSTFYLIPKYLTQQMHASPDELGMTTAAALIPGVLSVPLIGRGIDRIGRKPFIVWGALFHALGGLAFLSVHAVSPLLFAARALQGIAYVAVFTSISTLAVDLAPIARVGQAIGLCGAAGMAANALAPAAAEIIAEHAGWRTAFLLSVLCSLAAVTLGLRLQERRHEPAAVRREPSSPDLGRPLPLIFYAGAVVGAGFGAMFTYTQPFALGLGAERVSAFFIGYTVAALSMRIFLGTLADRLGHERVAFATIGMYGFVLLLTSLLRADMLFELGIAFGLVHGLMYPALNALALAGTPPDKRGLVMSYFSGAFNGGNGVWLLLMGALAKAQGYPLVFVVSGLLVWTALPALLHVRLRARES